jgi:hypothetical protein
VADGRVEGRKQPWECGGQYRQNAIRLEMRRGARELGCVCFDVFENIDVQDAIELLSGT